MQNSTGLLLAVQPFALALTLTVGASLVFIHQALAWGFIDRPDPRKVHTLPTPRTGGLSMLAGGLLALGVLVATKAFQAPTIHWQTWVSAAGFALCGAMDDRFSFQPKNKFFIFLAFSGLAAWHWIPHFQPLGAHLLGYINPSLPGFLAFPLMALALTFWFMAVPNAVNIEDAINGYMGGYILIVLAFLSVHGQGAGIPIGCLAGFLLFNWPKARHFMGDAGSFGGGFLLAEAILRSLPTANPLPAIIITAPISLDVAMGILRRRRKKMSLFAPDRLTLPHHLHRVFKGSHVWPTLILWANAAVFALAAYRPFFAVAAAIIYAGVLVCLNWDHLKRNQSPSLD
jgi:UDP-GlcNAc:undecaprenyl-phosphate GlcNAc-1-phosphate transferase